MKISDIKPAMKNNEVLVNGKSYYNYKVYKAYKNTKQIFLKEIIKDVIFTTYWNLNMKYLKFKIEKTKNGKDKFEILNTDIMKIVNKHFDILIYNFSYLEDFELKTLIMEE